MNTIREKDALRRAFAAPRFEIIPLRGAAEQARELPAGATVTVTCSPSRGVGPTLDLAEGLHALGYHVVPHLAARRLQSRAHLDTVLARLDAVGVRDVFVVGGDGGASSGPFASGVELLRAIAESEAPLHSIGVPCYPEGHSLVKPEALEAALDEKSAIATYMVTQICFDARTIMRWLSAVRARGVHLPVYIGIPGPIERRKLMSIALRIGLGDSSRMLRKNTGMVGRLMGPARFTADALIEGLAPAFADTTLEIAGLHVNTFNQVQSAYAWCQSWMSAFEDVDEGGALA